MKLSKLQLDKTIVVAFMLAIGAYFGFVHNVKPANATSNPSSLTGQYGCLLNRQGLGFGTQWQGQTVNVNSMAYLNFSSNTGIVVTGQVSGFNTNSPTATLLSAANDSFTEQVIPNTNNLAFFETFASGQRFIALPVNSGNTILLTEVEDSSSHAPWGGVCQKI